MSISERACWVLVVRLVPYPRDLFAARDEAFNSVVNGSEMKRRSVDQQVEKLAQFFTFVMTIVVGQLCIFQERAQDAQVCVTEGTLATTVSRQIGVVVVVVVRPRIEVEKVADDDVDENVQVVCVEILIGGRGGEQEIEKLEDQELGTEGRLAIQEQYEILAKGTIGRAVVGEDLDDAVGQGRV
jgi:hypothetical protein